MKFISFELYKKQQLEKAKDEALAILQVKTDFTRYSLEIDLICHCCGGDGCPECESTGYITPTHPYPNFSDYINECAKTVKKYSFNGGYSGAKDFLSEMADLFRRAES